MKILEVDTDKKNLDLKIYSNVMKFRLFVTKTSDFLGIFSSYSYAKAVIIVIVHVEEM